MVAEKCKNLEFQTTAPKDSTTGTADADSRSHPTGDSDTKSTTSKEAVVGFDHGSIRGSTRPSKDGASTISSSDIKIQKMGMTFSEGFLETEEFRQRCRKAMANQVFCSQAQKTYLPPDKQTKRLPKSQNSSLYCIYEPEKKGGYCENLGRGGAPGANRNQCTYNADFVKRSLDGRKIAMVSARIVKDKNEGATLQNETGLIRFKGQSESACQHSLNTILSSSGGSLNTPHHVIQQQKLDEVKAEIAKKRDHATARSRNSEIFQWPSAAEMRTSRGQIQRPVENGIFTARRKLTMANTARSMFSALSLSTPHLPEDDGPLATARPQSY